MKTSQIKFLITLDKDKIPEKITWNADDKMGDEFSETKSISLALWDHKKMNTLKIDLWTKDMKVNDMKRFYIDCIGGIGQSVLNSTGDEYISKELNKLSTKHFIIPVSATKKTGINLLLEKINEMN